VRVTQSQGNQAVIAEEYDKAIHLYNRAIEMDPNNAIYYNNRSAAYFRKGDLLQALADAQ
jgi:tetratricopeptide (TPR) repeat protein